MANVEDCKSAGRYEDSSGSESDNESVSFKRSKRSKNSEGACSKYKKIHFSAGTNGSQKAANGSSAVGGSRSVDVVDYSRSRRAKIVVSPKKNLLKNGHSNVEPSADDIMAQMGFEKGKGLAKFVKPKTPPKYTFSIEKFELRLKELGLDSVDTDLDLGSADTDWFSEELKCEEEVTWIQPEVPEMIDLSVFLSWRKIGLMSTSLNEEKTFVKPKILKEIISWKELFQDLPEDEYQQIRARANVFERIGKGPFICRAAMKMANLDSVLEFALTEPTTQSTESRPSVPVIGTNDLFYFADVCAGPGGFTEYVLSKKHWEAKGFGLTLKGNLDFNTAAFLAAESESFEAYYGPANDGNIYNPDNVIGYLNYVLSMTDGKGVHLMMADGGFSVSKQENKQEILSGQIVLSQCLVAIGIVRIGGHFVCKLFDVFTAFSVGLIYLMYLSFNAVSIHKPNSSRPANSERYLICKWKREGTDTIKKYLMDCHRLMWEFTNKTVTEKDSILELVPLSRLTKADHPFFKYIWESNNSIGKKQIASLKTMVDYARDPNLINEQQMIAKQDSLRLWFIPEVINNLELNSTDKMFKDMLKNYPSTLVKHLERPLSPDILEYFISPFDWRFVVVTAHTRDRNRGFYLGMGRNLVYWYDGHSWILKTSIDQNIELPSNTLVYGEFVNEVLGKKPSQVVAKVFHIIDAMILGGQDIRDLHYTQRHEWCVKFAKAMKKTVAGTLPIRVKPPIRMENIADVIDRLEHRVIKGEGTGAKLVCPIDLTDKTSPYIKPTGLLFIKMTMDPWQMALNRHANRKFLFNTATGQACDGLPAAAILNFFMTMGNRVTWWWDKDTNVTVSSIEASDPRMHNIQKVHAYTLVNHVNVALRNPNVVFSPDKRKS